MTHLEPHARTVARRTTTSSRASACSTTPRSATTSRSSRRCEPPQGLSEAEQKLYDLVARRFMSVFFPSAEYLVTTRISQAAGAQLQDRRQGAGPARLACHLRQGGAGRRRRRAAEPGAGQARRKRARRERRHEGPEDAPAGPLLGSHAAWRDGRRRQAGRRRRAARGDAGEGARHARHARGDHRGPAQREVHDPRRPRADSDRQGLSADDAAARTRRRGAVEARADGRVGVQARADGARPAWARRVHARNRRDDEAHRQEGEGVRPRHGAGRLRHARDAVSELRRRGEGELPPLHLHAARTATARAAASRSARRPADARSSPPRSSSSCATRGLVRSRGSARRPAGRSRRRSCSSTTRKKRTGSSSSTSATTTRKPASSWTSRARSRSDSARSAAAAYSSPAATTSARTPCGRRRRPNPTCDFKSRKVILQQPIEREQMIKLLETGKTDLLEKFISMRTRRPFKATWPGTRRRARSTSSSRRRSSRARERARPAPARAAAAAGPASARKAGTSAPRQDGGEEARGPQGAEVVTRQAGPDAERRACRRDRHRAGRRAPR